MEISLFLFSKFGDAGGKAINRENGKVLKSKCFQGESKSI